VAVRQTPPKGGFLFLKNKLAKTKTEGILFYVMNNKTQLTQTALINSVRKPLPPASRPFTDKRAKAKDKRKDWKREEW
jgi:hypothetical protein